jgi:hypothetical protein
MNQSTSSLDASIGMMRERGYTELQIDAILRANGRLSTPALADYLDGRSLAEIEFLTLVTFGVEQ